MTNGKTELEWKLIRRREVYSNAIFAVDAREMERRAAAGASGEFFVIKSSSWVNIVALTDDDEVVLVEQWRHAVSHPTLEIPGGGIDEDESPAEAARRELLEETGFSAREWRLLGEIEPNPAIHENRCFTYLALGATKTAEPQFDTHEHCVVHLRRFCDLERDVAGGRISHALVVVALYYERLRREGHLTARSA
jgi:ADP-ribose pyrophosphatase